jgi:3-hydroxyacyl-[acyl-carrier-protein] dehydratase
MKFRMIDQIVEWERDRSIRGVKAVSFEEYSMRMRLGDRERLPESLILESVCQLASWLIILSSDFAQMALLVGIEQAEFCGPLGPGERLSISVRARGSERHGNLFDGIGRTRDHQVLRVTGLLMRQLPLKEYQDADDLRVLFTEIHRPIQGEPA